MVAHHQGRRLEGGVIFFIRPREAGEGDHWSSRSERTVVEGALDSPLRCCCRSVKADKFNSLKARNDSSSLSSALNPASSKSRRRPRPFHHASRGPPSPLSRGRMKVTRPANPRRQTPPA